MLNQNDLKQIKKIFDDSLETKLEEKLETKLEEKLDPIRQQLFTIQEDIKWIKKEIEQIRKPH